MPHVLVRDIEPVFDLVGFVAANGHEGKTEDEIRAELGDKNYRSTSITRLSASAR
jgi:hypothetical protein